MTADDSKWREMANPGKAPEQGSAGPPAGHRKASTRSKRSKIPCRTPKEPVKTVVLGLSRQSVSFPVIRCHQVSSAVISCHPVPSLVVIACHPVSSAAIIQCHSVSSAAICCHPLSSGVISCHLILFSWCPTTQIHSEWVTKTTPDGSPKPLVWDRGRRVVQSSEAVWLR